MKNFDKFIAESQKHGTNYTLFGKTYYLPASIPAGTVFMIRKMGKIQELNSNAEVAEEMFWELFTTVYGKENLAEWRKEPLFGYELATEMLKESMIHYGVSAETPDVNTEETTEKKVPVTRNRKK